MNERPRLAETIFHLDITNPASPVIVGSVDTPGDGWGVAVAGSHAYVASGGSGLQIVPTQCRPWHGDPKAHEGVAATERVVLLR